MSWSSRGARTARSAARLPDRAGRDRVRAAATPRRDAGRRPGTERRGHRRRAGGVPRAGRVHAVRRRAEGARRGALPGYMVPSTFVLLDTLPLLPNGKLDRRALPKPQLSRTASRTPRDEREAELCRIFAELVGRSEVGIDDSFFDLGGDSITSIQLVARSRKAGVVFSPRDVFEHKTVAALAAVAGSQARPVAVDVGVGEVPLTPIMHWLRDLGGSSDGFHQHRLVTLPEPTTSAQLRSALAALTTTHDMLRARLSEADGDWALTVPEATASDIEGVLRRVRPSEGQDLQELFTAEKRRAVAELSPRDGAMLRAVWFDLDDQPGHLLIVVHHLAVDAVSWRILVADFEAALSAARAGRAGPRSGADLVPPVGRITS
ncbi:condensation domain-containing protein [Micromonospora sp. M12]